MSQYRLLKDLPGFKSGTIFDELWDGTPCFEGSTKLASLKWVMKDFPEWFRPLKD